MVLAEKRRKSMPCVSRVVAQQGFLLRRGEDEVWRFACLPQSSGNLLAYPEHDLRPWIVACSPTTGPLWRDGARFGEKPGGHTKERPARP